MMYKEQNFYEGIHEHLKKVYEQREARIVQNFNDGWCYTDELIYRPVDIDYDDSLWTPISLPHDYSIEGDFSSDYPSGHSGGFVRTGTLWYRKKFAGAPYFGRKTFLNFDGIGANAEIWINGVMVENHPYGYTPIYVDITNYIKEENIIAVKADTSLQPFSRFYQGTGIYRNVELISTAPLHIDHFGVTYKVKNDHEIEIRTKVRVAAYPETVWHDFGTDENVSVEKTCELKTEILDVQGNVIGQVASEQVIPEFSSYTFVQNVVLEKVELWNAENPCMYYIHSDLSYDGRLADDEVTPVGFRMMSYSSEEGLKINDVPTKLKGVCLHQDGGVFGASVPVKAWIKKLCILKNMGVNAIRTSHHPFAKEFYDICDMLGLYVMDEAFDEWKRGWSREASEMHHGKNLYGYHQFFEQWSESDVRLMVRRTKHHPSVLLWSVGNEIPDLYYQEGVQELQRLVRICKEEDDTRPVTVCAEGQYRLPIADGIMDSVDIAGFNYVNIKHPDYFENLHKLHPDWVFLSSETFFEPQQWAFIEEHNYAIGQFLWAGYDYLGECHRSLINDLSNDFSNLTYDYDPGFGGLHAVDPNETGFVHGWTSALVDIADQPKCQYYYHQSLWKTEPVIHICTKMYEWNEKGLLWSLIPGADIWNGVENEPKTMYCFTNCDEVKIYLNDELVYEAERPSLWPLEFPITYQHGQVKAVGFVNGKEVCQHILTTPGIPKKLSAEIDYPVLKADGKDLCQINIRVVDENECPVMCKIPVEIELEGEADLFRVGNGGNDNKQSYCSSVINTHNGHMIAVVKTRKTTGTAVLKAKAQGLEPVEIEINII